MIANQQLSFLMNYQLGTVFRLELDCPYSHIISLVMTTDSAIRSLDCFLGDCGDERDQFIQTWLPFSAMAFQTHDIDQGFHNKHCHGAFINYYGPSKGVRFIVARFDHPCAQSKLPRNLTEIAFSGENEHNRISHP